MRCEPNEYRKKPIKKAPKGLQNQRKLLILLGYQDEPEEPHIPRGSDQPKL